MSGVADGAWTMTDWDTPVSASRSIFIPSILRNAAPSLESSLIVQIVSSSQPREHAFVQGAGEKGRLSSSRVPLSVGDNTPPVAPVARIQVNTKRNWAAPAQYIYTNIYLYVYRYIYL